MHKYFLIIVSFIVFLTPICSSAQKQSDINSFKIEYSNRQVFLKNLKSEGQELVSEIELRCGQPIRYFISSLSDRIAQARINESGVPEVTIDTSKKIDEEIIVHELYHIKMWLDGYPRIVFGQHILKPLSQQDQNLLDILLGEVFDPIEHYIFYPKLREIGYDPDRFMRDSIKSMIVKKEILGLRNKSYADLAFDYFQCSLEVFDKNLISALDKLYREKQADQALKLGKKMAEIVYNSNFQSSEEEAKAFLKCLELIFKDKWSFEFVEWKTENAGSVPVNYAVIGAIRNY